MSRVPFVSAIWLARCDADVDAADRSHPEHTLCVLEHSPRTYAALMSHRPSHSWTTNADNELFASAGSRQHARRPAFPALYRRLLCLSLPHARLSCRTRAALAHRASISRPQTGLPRAALGRPSTARASRLRRQRHKNHGAVISRKQPAVPSSPHSIESARESTRRTGLTACVQTPALRSSWMRGHVRKRVARLRPAGPSGVRQFRRKAHGH